MGGMLGRQGREEVVSENRRYKKRSTEAEKDGREERKQNKKRRKKKEGEMEITNLQRSKNASKESRIVFQ